MEKALRGIELAKTSLIDAETRRTDPPKLLVSVRNLAEFRVALAAGVDIIDWKEPRRGALAATDPEYWPMAVEELDSLRRNLQAEAEKQFLTAKLPKQTIPSLSAAIGDFPAALAIAEQVPGRFQFAKASFGSVVSKEKRFELWETLQKRLAPTIEMVAVFEVDLDSQTSPCDFAAVDRIRELQEWNRSSNEPIRTVLIDTHDKHQKSSIELIGIPKWNQLVQEAKRWGIQVVLAGGLEVNELTALMENQDFCLPDCFGFRSAACKPSELPAAERRKQEIEGTQIQKLKKILCSRSRQAIGSDRGRF